jgi:HK97 family phage portal protein
MNLLERLVKGAEYRSGLANPQGWLVDAMSGAPSYSGKRVTPQSSVGLHTVFSAVTYISDAVAQLPLKVYRDLAGETVEARDHRAWRMLHDKPNPVTGADRFWSTVTTQLLLWGNAFIELIRNDSGLVEELWLLDPAQITVNWNANTRTKKYVLENESGRRRIYSSDDVLHVFGTSLNGLMGLSRISECRQMLGTALARDEFEGGFYQRGATLRGVIEHPNRVGETGLKNIRESFTKIYSGSSKAHQTGVLEEGASFKPLNMTMKDLEFVAAQQLSASQVAVMFKLPPSFLGGTSGDSLTYATVEGNQIQFAQYAVTAPAVAIAKAVSANQAIFPFGSWYCEFVLEGLMRGDAHSRGEFYKALRECDAITPNEIRARENMPPKPGGDDLKAHVPAPLAAAPDPAGNGNGNGTLPEPLPNPIGAGG